MTRGYAAYLGCCEEEACMAREISWVKVDVEKDLLFMPLAPLVLLVVLAVVPVVPVPVGPLLPFPEDFEEGIGARMCWW